MREISYAGAAGEEERSAGPCAPDAPAARLGWLSRGNLELCWKQRERKEERTGFPERANTQGMLVLSTAEAGAGHGLGCAHTGCSQDRSRDVPWSWAAPTTLLPVM